MHLEAGWRVVGIITERRELKSPKNEKWRGYVCKVATLGMTAELQLSPEQFTAVTEGQHIAAVGTFEESGGVLRLRTSKITDAETKRAGGAA